MLDLRGTNSSQSEQPAGIGVPSVGSTDVSFTPPPRRSSPVLDAGSNAPAGRGITSLGAAKSDSLLLVVALVSIAVAGVTGLVASYLVTQEQVKLAANTAKFDQSMTKLHSGQTGKNLALIETTANQLNVLATTKTAQTPWVSLLDALGGQIPGTIQLKNASFDSTTKLLTLTGSGATYDDVAHAIAALEASDRFSNVVLQNAAASQVETTVKVDFSVIAQYLPTQIVPAVVTTPAQGATR